MLRIILEYSCIIVTIAFISCGTTDSTLASHDRLKVGESGHQLKGIASYYANEFDGRKTSSGEVYDMHALTAAHRTLPFNTRVKVINLENKKSVVVRVNDRGPFKGDRVIDVSLEAAKKLGLIVPGTASVKLEILEFGKD